MTEDLMKQARELAFSMRHSAGQWMVPGWDGHKCANLLDSLIAALATPAPAQPEGQEDEPAAWESTTICYRKFISQRRYEASSPSVRSWYKPYRCSACAAVGAAAPAEGAAWQPIESVPGTQEPVLLWTHSGQIRVETGWYARNLLEESKEDDFECAFTHWRPRLAAPTSPPQAAQEGKAS